MSTSRRGKKPQVNPLLAFRRVQDIGGISWFVKEILRNAAFHGRATNVRFDVRKMRATDGEPSLVVFDNGKGMDEAARERCGLGFGYSDVSNGTGARETALSLAQFLEFQTVHESDPDWVWAIKIPMVQFALETQQDNWRGEWLRLPRNRATFSQDVPHGTMVILSDFRTLTIHEVRDADQASRRTAFVPTDDHFRRVVSMLAAATQESEERIQQIVAVRSTAHHITEDNIRRIIPKEFPPDIARLVFVGGKQVQVPAIEGFLLWKESVSEKPKLGKVSGEVRLSDTGAGNWLVIGGTTATVPILNFIAGFTDHNPELAVLVPKIFSREKRLTGFIRMGLLEQFPTPGRMHLLSEFYTGPEARMVIDELVRIASKMEEQFVEFERRPRADVTESLVTDVIARMHQMQEIRPGVAPGGGGDEQGPTGVDDEVKRLLVSPPSVHLEPWDRKSVRDRVTITVANPMPGEEFDWSDRGVGLIKSVSGPSVEVEAIEQVGVYLIDVRSRSYPAKRNRPISVDVRPHRKAPPAPSREEFCLTPMATTIVVGQERIIRIRQQGASSGNYIWSVQFERMTKHKEPVRLDLQPGAREVRVVGLRPGDCEVLCTDAKKATLVARTKIEVLANVEEPTGTVSPTGTPGSGPNGPTSGGVGNPAVDRPSYIGGRSLFLKFKGNVYRMEVRTTIRLREPFFFEVEQRLLQISDLFLPRSEEPEAQRRHIVHCIVAGAAFLLQSEGVLQPDDHVGYAQLMGGILQMVLFDKEEKAK